MQDNVWLSMTGLGIDIKSNSENSYYNAYQNFKKIEHGDNIGWQMHNSISDVSVLGCKYKHKIVIMI